MKCCFTKRLFPIFMCDTDAHVATSEPIQSSCHYAVDLWGWPLQRSPLLFCMSRSRPIGDPSCIDRDGSLDKVAAWVMAGTGPPSCSSSLTRFFVKQLYPQSPPMHLSYVKRLRSFSTCSMSSLVVVLSMLFKCVQFVWNGFVHRILTYRNCY